MRIWNSWSRKSVAGAGKLLAITASMTLSSGMVADTSDPVNGQVVNVEARYLFTPVGFDDNDEVVTVVDGYLPSGCYRLTRPEVTLDEETHTVLIAPKARYFDVPCVEALIPYSFEVRLGVLPEGDYKLKVTGEISETLAVAEATNAGPDDFLYAPIDEASVKQDSATGELQVTLAGRFTNSCMTFSEVRIEDHGATLNVLPIIEIAGQDCQAGEFPFRHTTALPESISVGRHLLHVRSLNGQSVNHLFFKNPL